MKDFWHPEELQADEPAPDVASLLTIASRAVVVFGLVALALVWWMG
jgi:hypothetical protein